MHYHQLVSFGSRAVRKTVRSRDVFSFPSYYTWQQWLRVVDLAVHHAEYGRSTAGQMRAVALPSILPVILLYFFADRNVLSAFNVV